MKKNLLSVSLLLILLIGFSSCFLIPINNFTISYDNNEGIGSMNDQHFQRDSSVILSTSTFTHQHNIFVRWDTKASGTGVSYDDGETITPGPSDLTLYAIWSEDLVINPYLVYHSFSTGNVIDLRAPGTGDIDANFIAIDFVNGDILFNQDDDDSLVQFMQENNTSPGMDFGYLVLILSADIKSVNDTNGMLVHIPNDTLINGSTAWDANISDISGSQENWGDESHVYIPIAMKIDSSTFYYYGYIEVSFDNDPGLLTIHSIAYMNAEGASITAGQQP
jgi:Listeria-Bacteroides repeat domain (List_Bact_rpt)